MKKQILILFACALSYLLAGCSKKENVMPASASVEPAATENVAVNAVGAAGIAGVNWADGRDNFVDGWVIPSGLTAADSYTTVSAKANAVLSGFQTNIAGANTVRLPINPPSVL